MQTHLCIRNGTIFFIVDGPGTVRTIFIAYYDSDGHKRLVFLSTFI